MKIPAPLKILDPAAETSLHIDADLGATGNGLAIITRGDGTRISVALDLEDIRNLRHWADDVLRACEATRCQERESGGVQCSAYGKHDRHYVEGH